MSFDNTRGEYELSNIDVIQLILSFVAGSGITIVVLLIYLIKNPEKIEKWASMFYRLFAAYSKNAARKYMATNIQSTIDEGRKQLDLDERGLAYGLQMKWSDSETIETDLDKNNIVVMMRPYKSQAKNLAHVISVYLPEALLPKSRRYVDPDLMKSIDQTLSKAFLKHNSTALNYYTALFMDTLENSITEMINRLEELNDVGYLTRVLVPELEKLSALYPRESNSEIAEETKELYNCISDFVRKIEDSVPLEGEGIFSGSVFNMAIIPIGKPELLLTSGITKHCAFVEKLRSEGIGSFYVVSTETLMKHYNELLTRICKELKCSIAFQETYAGVFRKHKRNLVCALLVSSS